MNKITQMIAILGLPLLVGLMMVPSVSATTVTTGEFFITIPAASVCYPWGICAGTAGAWHSGPAPSCKATGLEIVSYSISHGSIFVGGSVSGGNPTFALFTNIDPFAVISVTYLVVWNC